MLLAFGGLVISRHVDAYRHGDVPWPEAIGGAIGAQVVVAAVLVVASIVFVRGLPIRTFAITVAIGVLGSVPLTAGPGAPSPARRPAQLRKHP